MVCRIRVGCQQLVNTLEALGIDRIDGTVSSADVNLQYSVLIKLTVDSLMTDCCSYISLSINSTCFRDLVEWLEVSAVVVIYFGP